MAGCEMQNSRPASALAWTAALIIDADVPLWRHNTRHQHNVSGPVQLALTHVICRAHFTSACACPVVHQCNTGARVCRKYTLCCLLCYSLCRCTSTYTGSTPSVCCRDTGQHPSKEACLSVISGTEYHSGGSVVSKHQDADVWAHRRGGVLRDCWGGGHTALPLLAGFLGAGRVCARPWLSSLRRAQGLRHR